MKYKKHIIGILILPPKTPESPTDLLVVMDFKEAKDLEDKYRKKKELEEKLWAIGDKTIGKIARPPFDEKTKDTRINCILIPEVWDMCLKGKYEILKLITMGAPVYDAGWVGAMRAVELHKMRVLDKFEKYVVSYVLGGSMIRGDTVKGSDVDAFIVIDDTDVTRMTSSELKAKLQSITWGMASEAAMAAGVKNKMNIQVYVLTGMWDSIKNAHPVIFTFLRDGIPLYDRGMFAPWKLLLKKGKITPTPEAVESYMKSGKQMLERTRHKLREIAIDDFFWATSLPSQGALMLLGFPPPTHKEVVGQMREHLVKPGFLEEKWVKVLEKNITMRKKIEHGDIKEVDPDFVGEQLKASEKYLERLGKLFEQLEKDKVVEEAADLYEKAMEDAQAALKMVGIKVTKKNALKMLKQELVDKQLAPSRYHDVLTRIIDIKEKPKTSRAELASLAFEQAKLAQDVFSLIRAEKGQKVEKCKINIKYDKSKKTAGVWLFTDTAFVILDTSKADTSIYKFKVDSKGALVDKQRSNLTAIEKKLKTFAGTSTKVTDAMLRSLKDLLGKDIELVVGA
jgi:predicted nucleotidyltransferase/uncharacterized protein (UPF0332 family)